MCNDRNMTRASSPGVATRVPCSWRRRARDAAGRAATLRGAQKGDGEGTYIGESSDASVRMGMPVTLPASLGVTAMEVSAGGGVEEAVEVGVVVADAAGVIPSTLTAPSPGTATMTQVPWME